MIALAAFLVRDRVVRLQNVGHAPLELPLGRFRLDLLFDRLQEWTKSPNLCQHGSDERKLRPFGRFDHGQGTLRPRNDHAP